MKRTTLINLVFLFFAQIIISQELHKRVTVSSTSQTTINILLEKGIDLRCGAVFDQNSIQLELSESELAHLRNRGVSYTVDIEDMVAFYDKRITDNIELAKAELEFEKNNGISLRSAVVPSSISEELIPFGAASVSSTSLDNFLQYDECNEVDWAVPQNFNLNPNPAPNSFGGCLTVSQVEAELDEMRALFPNLISVKMDASPIGERTLGNTLGPATFPGQTVYYVRISDNPDVDEANEPEILYTSMIHAREVSSLMSNLFYMWYLLENYATDPAIKNLVDNNEMYFIPVVNPDGLRWNEIITPNGGGLQRKNLRVTNGDTGTITAGNNNRGVDLNRNFDYLWGADGDPNGSTAEDQGGISGTYRGTNPFSEPESRILRDFVLSRNFETALMHHSFANRIPHPYGGIPSRVSGREDEMHQWHEDMTRFNRYVSGATIFTPANGIADDWMLGGAPDGGNTTSNTLNGNPNDVSPPSIGSGRNILASTPENGTGAEGGFWPNPANIVPIAKRAMRVNLMNAYYAGQYARLHDLTLSNISSLTSNLEFGIERLGQTASNFTLIVTPVSSNITSITSIPSQTGMTILEQRNVTTQIVLNPSIQPNETIEYRVQLANGNGVIFYDANIEKIYQPTVLLFDNGNNLNNWTVAGGQWASVPTNVANNPFPSNNASSGNVIKAGINTPYATNRNSTLTTTNSYDFSGANQILIQFYTRWDLERNYDFVEIEGSTNGTTWLPLCGVYNKPEAPSSNNGHDTKFPLDTGFQQNSSGRVYDGDRMDKWVMEEIVIDPTHNNFLVGATNAQIRFRFRTDGGNAPENYSTNYSGFFIDDFTISRIDIPCVTSVPTNVTASTVGITNATITWDDIPSATYDLRYREFGTSTFTDVNNIPTATNSLDINGLSPNTTYEVQIRSRCTTATSAFSLLTSFTTLPIPPCTGPSIASFPYTESFESGLGLWTQSVTDDIDWTQRSGSTPSVTSGPTGPLGASVGAQYLYTESSGNGTGFPNMDAILNSPCFDLTGHINAQFSFDYHMFGAAMGDLSIQVSIDNGASYTTIPNTNITTNGINPGVNPISGQQQATNGEAWRTQMVNLSQYDNQVIRLRFLGTTGSSFSSDISIDNINLTATPAPTGPTAITQNIIIDLDASGNASITEDAINNGSTGAGTLIFDTDITSFTCADIGDNSVTLTVTDSNGSDSSSAIVTVRDIIAPIPDVAVLADINAQCEVTTLTSPSATDNCGGTVTVTNNASLPITAQGTTTITWTYTDANGNSATQDQNIIIDDTTAPTASNPAPVNVQCAADVPAVDISVVTDEADNCGTPTVAHVSDVSDGGSNPEVITRTYSVTDAAGNSINVTQTITVNDTTAPTASNPAPVNVQCAADVPAVDISVVTDEADNCGTPTVAHVSDVSDGGSNPEVITRTYSVTDAAGNSINVTQTITVNDTTAPTASNPAPVDVQCAADVPAVDITVVTDEADNCGTPTVAHVSDVSDGGSNPEVITRTYSVTDAAGNSINVTQTITVNDTTAPTAICQAYTVNLNGAASVDITAADIDGGSFDNCGTITLSASQTTFTAADIGDVTVTLTVTDENGNSATCDAIVTVTDSTLSSDDFDLRNVAIYPNPFSSNITIKLPLRFNNSDFEIMIIDLNGRIVHRELPTSINGQINVSSLNRLAEGTYFIRVTSKEDRSTITKKLIKYQNN